MKSKSNTYWFIAIGLPGSLVLGVLATAMGDAHVSMNQVPEAARRALQRLAGGAPIDEVELEKRHGSTVYEAEWQADGVSHEAVVTADGIVIETEETVPLDDVPSAVRAAIAKHFGSDVKVVVEKKTFVLYEAEAEIDGREKELLIFPTGRVHEHGNDDDDDAHEGHDHGDHDDDD